MLLPDYIAATSSMVERETIVVLEIEREKRRRWTHGIEQHSKQPFSTV
jgi:hypothetical protein